MQTKTFNPQVILFIAAFAAFIATFNETYLNVAFTPIMTDLHIDTNTVQWLTTAYMLGAAVMVPVSAFLYRNIPTRFLFLGSVGVLILGSIVGVLAWNFPVLLIGRIIQSLGTGILIPVGMNVTLEAAAPNVIGRYLGIVGAMTTLGPSLSVLVAGGLLSVSGGNWHLLFGVFAVLSALCFLAAFAKLPNLAQLTRPKLDVLSTILISFALIGILYGISTSFSGNVLGSVVSAVIGIVCLAAFVLRQRSIPNPLIHLKPLGVRIFRIGVIINMISLIVIFAMNILLPVYLQGTLEADAMVASLVLFPAILLSCIVAPLAGRAYDKHGVRVLLPAGFILMAAALAAIVLTISTGVLWLIALLYIPVICGSALIIGPVQSFALSRLSPELIPHGVVVMSTGFQIAGCIGSSLFMGVYSVFFASGEAGFSYAVILAAAFAVAGLVLAAGIGRLGSRKMNTA
ncbi:MAG: MFS transporter [Methanocorpusculum sp.]|nr:MFS transporter [Methanocorpusculum sp.]